MSNRPVWFDARNMQDEDKIIPFVTNTQLNCMVVNKDLLSRVKLSTRVTLVVVVENLADLEGIAPESIILSGQETVLEQARKQGHKTALHQLIVAGTDLDSVWKDGIHHNYLVVELTDETNIPLELLIARLQNMETQLIKLVRTYQEMEITLGVMEVGSDGVLVKSEDTQEIMSINQFITNSQTGKLGLVKGKVVEVQHVGMGFRACIDTTSLLNQNEGMIIGSTSTGGLLVSSETHFLPYMELRPFRVNAGAVHSYVWTPENMTQYITELKGGSKVLVVDTQGNTREVSVGRVKIEMRPLLRIVVDADGAEVNTIVQDDWHIRIFGGNGEPRNASSIKKGDELLVYICEGGRHVGIKIDETIVEK